MDYKVTYGPLEVLCRKDEASTDLYFLEEGKLLICTAQGTQVKALARITPGEFIGELSFFDGKPRSTSVVTLEKSVVIKIPKKDLIEQLPFWFIEVGKNLTKKIRLLDEIAHTSNFRKVATEDQKPLTIDEQRKILAALNK